MTKPGDPPPEESGIDDELDELLDDDRPLTPEELAAIAAEDDELKHGLSTLGAEEAEQPAPAFTTRVMKDVQTIERPWWKRAADAIWRPSHPALQRRDGRTADCDWRHCVRAAHWRRR